MNPKTGQCFDELRCKTGKYWDLIHESCKSCHSSCKNCIEQSETDCISCSLDKILFPLEGICKSCDSLNGYMINKKTKVCEKICTPYDTDCLKLSSENLNCDKINCKTSPTVKLLLNSKDPYNLIIEYDRDMKPEIFCNFELTFDKLLHYQFETDIRPLGLKKCLIHIIYKDHSFGDTVYIFFKDVKSIRDKFNNSLNESQEMLHASITGYMLESETKDRYTQMSILASRGIIILTSFVAMFIILLSLMKPGLILWSLIDFLQRLAILGMLSSEIPFNIRTLFNAFSIFNFEISLTHQNFPGGDFLKYSWVVILIMALLELIVFLIAVFCRMFDFGGKDNLIWSFRLRLFSLISTPLVISICISLKESSDITSKILALIFSIVYSANFVQIWQSLGQQNVLNSPQTIEIFNRYEEYLQEINIKSHESRLYEPIMIINRVIMIIIVLFIDFNPRVQFIILMLVETGILFYINKYEPANTQLNTLNIIINVTLISIKLVFLWIMDSPDVLKNFKYCWFMEIGIGIVILYMFATGFNQFLNKILHNDYDDNFITNLKSLKDQMNIKDLPSKLRHKKNRSQANSRSREDIDEEERSLKQDY